MSAPSPVLDFRVELDRDEAEYRAGEVVRGKVLLSTAESIEASGVRIRLRGEAWSCWSADTRTSRASRLSDATSLFTIAEVQEYSAYKLYQDISATIFGDFYGTGLVYDVVEDGDWDQTVKEGTMYLPIHAGEDAQLPDVNVILRVCDNDRDNAECILGEVLVNLASLLQSDDEQTLALQKKGRAAYGRDDAPSLLTFASRLATFDDLVSEEAQNGRATQVLVLDVKKVRGLWGAGGGRKRDIYCQAYRAPAGTEVASGSLPDPESVNALPAGDHILPFAIPVRIEAPASVEFDEKSYIRYHLCVNIHHTEAPGPSAFQPLTVLPSRPLPKASLLMAAFGELYPEEKTSTLSFPFSLCSNRSATMRTTLGRQAYAPGEVLSFSANIANDTSTELRFSVHLRRELCKQNSAGEIETTPLFFLITEATVKPHQNVTLTGAELEARVPHLPPSFFGVAGVSQTRDDPDPLTWTYCVEAHLGPSRLTSAASMLHLPILLSPLAGGSDAPNGDHLQAKEFAGFQTGWTVARQIQRKVQVSKAVESSSAADVQPRMSDLTKGDSSMLAPFSEKPSNPADFPPVGYDAARPRSQGSVVADGEDMDEEAMKLRRRRSTAEARAALGLNTDAKLAEAVLTRESLMLLPAVDLRDSAVEELSSLSRMKLLMWGPTWRPQWLKPAEDPAYPNKN